MRLVSSTHSQDFWKVIYNVAQSSYSWVDRTAPVWGRRGHIATLLYCIILRPHVVSRQAFMFYLCPIICFNIHTLTSQKGRQKYSKDLVVGQTLKIHSNISPTALLRVKMFEIWPWFLHQSRWRIMASKRINLSETLYFHDGRSSFRLRHFSHQSHFYSLFYRGETHISKFGLIFSRDALVSKRSGVGLSKIWNLKPDLEAYMILLTVHQI